MKRSFQELIIEGRILPKWLAWAIVIGTFGCLVGMLVYVLVLAFGWAGLLIVGMPPLVASALFRVLD